MISLTYSEKISCQGCEDVYKRQVMTSGGPNHATEVMSTYMYYQSFNILNYGYASAIGCLLYTSYSLGRVRQIISAICTL